VGLDLPSAALGSMIVGRLRGANDPELFIATAGAGVLIFTSDGLTDGSGRFLQLLPQDPEARDVTSLLALPTGELLIGTRKRGVLVYGGKTAGQSGGDELRTFQAQLATSPITAMAADATGIWIGTHDRGVRYVHGGQTDSFESGGDSFASLPDQQVDAIAVHGDRVYVGTPLGVEEFVNGRPSRRLAKDLFAHALYADDKGLTIGSINQGIKRVSLEVSRRPGAGIGGFRDAILNQGDGNPARVEEFLRADSTGNDEDLYGVMQSSLIRQTKGGGWQSLTATAPAAERGKEALTDGNISALAFDPEGRLWVGYFDRGLDVLSTNGQLNEHYEDDRLFCVNRVVMDPRRKTMAVATANGLVLFGEHGNGERKSRQVMTRRDGLIADHITDIAFSGDTMVLATPAGVSYVDASGVRSLYAFEGLVNNHVYALGVQADSGQGRGMNDEVLAGTLGGISELKHESVRRNLTVTNSGLKHNWVTAIVPSGDPGAWFVGTYGGGIMLLDKDGRFVPMEGATTDMDVNPNAMLATQSHIFAGTLGNGLWVWSRARGRWVQITAGLPSQNVTAIAEHGGEVYVGTENGLVRIAEHLLD
jgi:ligand-binding sensor domain-containing protein